MLGAVRNGLRQALLNTKSPVTTAVRNNRGNGGVAVGVPAREKVPLMEEILLGGFIVASILFTPAWVLLHMREYSGRTDF